MTVTILKAKLRRIPLLILFLAVIVSLGDGLAVFSETPPVTAHWEINTPYNNHIGEVIKATLVTATQPGVSLDLTWMPDTGDVLALPPKVDNTPTEYPPYDFPQEILEGELEVVSRRITSHSEGGLVITEIAYEFLYLLPLDLTAPTDDKLLPWDVPLFQRYLRYFISGKIEPQSHHIFIEMADFYLVPRVEENSKPIFRLFEITPPATHWPNVKLAGFASLGLAICLLGWRAGHLIAAHKRQQEKIPAESPKADKLYLVWCESPDQKTFIEALKLYRRGVWGRPQASTWISTTFILYSGVNLNLDQMKTVFARLVKEVSNEPSA